jgi:hypothetical protein
MPNHSSSTVELIHQPQRKNRAVDRGTHAPRGSRTRENVARLRERPTKARMRANTSREGRRLKGLLLSTRMTLCGKNQVGDDHFFHMPDFFFFCAQSLLTSLPTLLRRQLIYYSTALLREIFQQVVQRYLMLPLQIKRGILLFHLFPPPLLPLPQRVEESKSVNI